MLRFTLLLAPLLVLPMAGSHAQERTASGNLQTETTWNALKTLVDAAQGTAKTAQITANGAMTKATKIEACGKKGLLYGPGVAGRDADDCISAAFLDKVISCGDQQMVYDKSANSCVKALATAPTCKLQVVSGTGRSGGGGGSARYYCGISSVGNQPNIGSYDGFIATSSWQAQNSSETSFSQHGYCLRVVCQ